MREGHFCGKLFWVAEAKLVVLLSRYLEEVNKFMAGNKQSDGSVDFTVI